MLGKRDTITVDFALHSFRESVKARKKQCVTDHVHVCEGISCAHVVETGESFVCSLTGKCVGSILIASHDYHNTSVAFTLSKNQSKASIKKVHASKFGSNSTLAEDVYGECCRVIERMFPQTALEETPESNTWREALAVRCAACCTMCVALLSAKKSIKVKSEYMCLAFLYMVREGLSVKGSIVCQKDIIVAERLPSLIMLIKFGYQKNKYTNAHRSLLEAIDIAQFRMLLHDLKV